MLFFGYKINPQAEGGRVRMDAGHTEHTGCPLREGRKWIATMCAAASRDSACPTGRARVALAHARVCVAARRWYREGMTAEKGWEAYRM